MRDLREYILSLERDIGRDNILRVFSDRLDILVPFRDL